MFTASIEPDGVEISHLNAETRNSGHCNDVETKPRSRRCGLAKYLMWICFQDAEILGKQKRGVNPLTNEQWKDERQKQNADKYCEQITYVYCMPDEDEDENIIPYIACVAYMRGAIKADFHVLFVYEEQGDDEEQVPLDIFNLKKVEAKFGKNKENAEKFVEDHGHEWFFCKCKEKYMKICLGMIKGKRNV